MVRFVHTADLQLGMPFHWANERARAKLMERREEAIDAVGRVAQEHNADFVLIAGDFFDANTVADDVVARTCQRLQQVNVPVFILPGNHDFFGGPDCVYQRKRFNHHKPDHVFVLDSPEPQVLLNGQAVILPAPIYQKNEIGDTTDHLTAEMGRAEAPEAVRIGLAHGGVIDFDGGEAFNRIDPVRAKQANLDYLALGDWHGCKQVAQRVWYSGTPEPTGFKANNAGHVLVVELPASKAVPKVTEVPTAQTDWLCQRAELSGPEDLDHLNRWFEELKRPLDTLVRLEVEGTLNLQEMAQLDGLLEEIQNTVLHLRQRGPGVLPKASAGEIDAIATDGYVRMAVDKLRQRSTENGEEAEIASRALQLLYKLKHQ